MIDMFIFLYVEEEKVWLQKNMYALKHCLIPLHFKDCQGSATKFKSCLGSAKKCYTNLKRTPREFNVWWSRISKGKVDEEFPEFGKVFQTGAKVLWTFWSVS